MEKTTRYNGKSLSVLHNPNEGVRFKTEDFFNILGVNPSDYTEPGEQNFIGYQVAIVYADNLDEMFAQWLRDNYEDMG